MEELKEAVASVHEAGRQVAIHAIEETVIEAAVDAVEFALHRTPRQDHRHRIEHCSVCPQRLLQRAAKLGIAIVTQPSFIYYSGDRYLQTVPPAQLDHLYAVRPMIESGLLVGAGSDFPIADPNPLVSISTAITCRTESGSAFPQQGVNVYESIRMHTLSAAATNFEEQLKGSLTPGKLADIIMLSENPFEIEGGHIKNLDIVLTILGGEVV
jgi:predicted amidohydrolase YtcJ